MESREHRIVLAALTAITRRDAECRLSVLVAKPFREGLEVAEATDVPVVFLSLDGGLQQDVFHGVRLAIVPTGCHLNGYRRRWLVQPGLAHRTTATRRWTPRLLPALPSAREHDRPGHPPAPSPAQARCPCPGRKGRMDAAIRRTCRRWCRWHQA